MANGRNGRNGKKDWLRGYIEYTSSQESPSIFHLWTGISVIASTLGRNVYVDRGYYKLYPNLYVVLVGASARVRKTTAINTGFSIFKEANPNACVLSQKMTPEALIGVLSKRAQERGCSDGVMVSTELSVFLGNSLKDDSLIQLLTKLYDCEEQLDYHTIIRGKEVCEKVCFNMIGGTTPEWIKTAMPAHAVGGGFTSRVIFVYQSEPERRVPFPTLTDEQRRLRVELVSELREIGKLHGEYKLTKDAIEWYEDWYCDVFKPERAEVALDGYYGRKHDTLLKVAMVISASRGGRLVIEEQDLVVALSALNENEKFLPEVMKSVMATAVGEERGKVLRAIHRRGEVSYGELLRALSYCMDTKRLSEVIAGLMEEGEIVEVIKGDKRWFRAKR